MKKIFLGWILCAGLILSSQQGMVSGTTAGINNSKLMPKWVPDSQVTMEGTTPNWVKTLIMEELRIETASDTHDFKGAVKALDHFQEMGVNGIWVTPVYQKSETNRASTNNGYGVCAPDQIDSVMTGTTDKEKSFTVAKGFVDEAHKRNIRVFFDIVIWGVDKESWIVKQHPEWVSKNGTLTEGWGGYLYTWSNPEWREWYINNAVQIALKTGIDGFRCDLEPTVTGYNLWEEVRKRLYAKGRKIAIISEGTSSRMNGVYDFEECGVGEEPDADMKWDAQNYYMDNNIVDSVKTGKGIGSKSFQMTGHGGEARFYTMNLLTHDSSAPRVRGNKVRIGYQAIYAPFIPFWFIGEEWNNPRKLLSNGTGVMYFNTIQWNAMQETDNRAFYESVKKMIQVRRTYPEIFENYPDNHKETNICKVESSDNSLQAYARYGGGKGILIVPNVDDKRKMTITIPYGDMQMLGAKGYKVTDLITGTVVKNDTAANIKTLSLDVETQDMRVLLVEATSTLPAQPTPTPSTSKIQSSGMASSSDASSGSVQSVNTDSGSAVSVVSGTSSSSVSSTNSGTKENSAPFTTVQLVLICIGSLVIIGSAFMIFYYLLNSGKIGKKK